MSEYDCRTSLLQLYQQVRFKSRSEAGGGCVIIANPVLFLYPSVAWLPARSLRRLSSTISRKWNMTWPANHLHSLQKHCSALHRLRQYRCHFVWESCSNQLWSAFHHNPGYQNNSNYLQSCVRMLIFLLWAQMLKVSKAQAWLFE